MERRDEADTEVFRPQPAAANVRVDLAEDGVLARAPTTRAFSSPA